MDRKIRKEIEFYFYRYEGLKKRQPNDDYVTLWLAVVENTLQWFSDAPKAELIKRKYFLKHSETKLCFDLYIQKTTLYNWINDIMGTALMFALSYGLVSIDKEKKLLRV